MPSPEGAPEIVGYVEKALDAWDATAEALRAGPRWPGWAGILRGVDIEISFWSQGIHVRHETAKEFGLPLNSVSLIRPS